MHLLSELQYNTLKIQLSESARCGGVICICLLFNSEGPCKAVCDASCCTKDSKI